MKTNQLGGQIGTDPIFVVSEAGGPRADRPEDVASGDELRLTTQEREVYEGGRGVVLQKTIRAVVAYGRLYGASHLVALDGAPHHALSWGSNGTAPLLKIYRQLAEAFSHARIREEFLRAESEGEILRALKMTGQG